MMHETEQLDLEVSTCVFTQEMPISNLGQDTAYPDYGIL
jgi:hypothetical protein